MTPESEAEITPEMIEAGATELARFNPDFQSLEDGAERIYLEMELARARSRRTTHCI
jgi:hypothetical protein